MNIKDVEYLKKYLNSKDLIDGLKRLENKEPVQYIVGNVDFYGYNFKIDKNVLIPRFETEQLIENTILYIQKIFNKKIDIVDLGTGSGCIAVTLKKQIDCNMDAIDISNNALDIAKNNALLNDVKINFIQNDMLNNIDKRYDVIISNPPYISYDEKIEEIVKNNEPSIALYADNNGLKYYEDILSKCQSNLNDKFLIAFEIGYKQALDIKTLALKYLNNIKIDIKKDLSNKDRFIFITNCK
ncbi:MAG: peptide chain release factor N(5)-glutamine methyltransferase [Bacilli bacterium]|nr:peptide chain release factor N(5)-glutamine methyltransferase [Bacilli bacterium]